MANGTEGDRTRIAQKYECIGSLLYCRYQNWEGYQCTIYRCRPLPCQAYDYRNDQCIWANFKNQIVSLDWAQLFRNSDAVEVSHHD